jgi:hypothetical protein
VNNVWVWYPCGVACSAGELVEEVSDLSGGVWKVQALYLRAGGGCSSLLVRRNGEYHHGDVLGNKGVITDGSGNVLSSNEGKGVGLEYDAFGVSMFISGSAQTPYRPAGLVLDTEGLDFSGPPVACPLYANRALALSEEQCGGLKKPPRPKPPRRPPPPGWPTPCPPGYQKFPCTADDFAWCIFLCGITGGYAIACFQCWTIGDPFRVLIACECVRGIW